MSTHPCLQVSKSHTYFRLAKICFSIKLKGFTFNTHQLVRGSWFTEFILKKLKEYRIRGYCLKNCSSVTNAIDYHIV